MTLSNKEAVTRKDDQELLGYIVHDSVGWQAQTIFGYPISHTETHDEAEKVLRKHGLGYLGGIWQYYDEDDRSWSPCVIKQAYEQRVIVNRTNELGYQDPDDYKQVIIDKPTENTLVKST